MQAIITNGMRDEIERLARKAGFDAAGVAGVPLPGSPDDRLQRERFDQWIEAGRGGEMQWLKRTDADGNLLRSSLHLAVPWARSVILCAVNYNTDAPRSVEAAPDGAGWIARYAWTGRTASSGEPMGATDYHAVMLEQLRQVEAGLRALLDGPFESRCYVDTGPVVERYIAQLAGVGWIGKNTCVLNQELGSWLLLGVILTSLPMADSADLLPAPDRCGSCTRCLDACPTDALVAPYQMDASRCIAYLTIEKKGEIPPELRSGMGRQVFGCDICQDVCPWNRRAPVGTGEAMQRREELVNPPLAWLAAMDNRSFRDHFRGSPLERTGRKRLLRNVAIAMGNSGDRAFLPQLQTWMQGDDAVLAEAAQWAVERIEERARTEPERGGALLASVPTV